MPRNFVLTLLLQSLFDYISQSEGSKSKPPIKQIKDCTTVSYFLNIILLLLLSACGNNENKKTLRINELLSANAQTNLDPDFKQFSDWIELYNDSNETINISHYYLSDKEDNPTKWSFPEETTIKPYGYLLIWADGKDQNLTNLHTNFKLSQSGETVTLSDAQAKRIETIRLSKQESDISFGKEKGKLLYMVPTPASKNSAPHTTPTRTDPVLFSLKGGFYSDSQVLELSHPDGANIYYTTDGSTPTSAANAYTRPVMIDKTMVIRAVAIENKKFASLVKTYTYLIDENITLPVVSISMDNKYLFDDKIGLYKNYTQDWMRAGNVEYIKDGVSQFSEVVGVQLSGATSRSYPQKSFSFYAKERFGVHSIAYPLFKDKPDIQNIKSFVLRNSGSDWQYTMIRDALIHTIAKEIGNIDYLSYQPTVAFINGQYYGIYNLREKPNKSYIAANHHVSENALDLLKLNKKKSIALSGDTQRYAKLMRYAQSHPAQDQQTYAYLSNNIDIDALINYNIVEQYVGNVDWPQNNMKYWRAKNSDSRWRWILVDTDMGFSLKLPDVPLTANVEHNPISRLDSPILDPNPEVILYRLLLSNPTFKNKFIAKYTTLLNTIFLPQNIDKKIKTLSDKIKPEISRHLSHWFQNQRDIKAWKKDIDKLFAYSNMRNKILRHHFKTYFNLKGDNKLHIEKSSHGTVYIENIKLKNTFDGYYFDSTQIRLRAEADQGYHFTQWSNKEKQKEITLTVHHDTINLKAFFEPDQGDF